MNTWNSFWISQATLSLKAISSLTSICLSVNLTIGTRTFSSTIKESLSAMSAFCNSSATANQSDPFHSPYIMRWKPLVGRQSSNRALPKYQTTTSGHLLTTICMTRSTICDLMFYSDPTASCIGRNPRSLHGGHVHGLRTYSFFVQRSQAALFVSSTFPPLDANMSYVAHMFKHLAWKH